MLTLLAEQSTIPLDHTLLITELQSANQSLEQHVAKRTSQLVTINKQLEVENTERKIAEEKILHINEELEQRVVERTQRLEDANQELVNSRKEIQGILDSMATLNAKVALDGTLLFANKIATQAAGVTFEELMKTNFLEGKWWTFDPEVQTRVKNAFAEAVSGIKISYDEKIFVFGQILAISFSLTPMLGSDDHVEYVLAEARDISKLKQIEESLQAKTIQLEAANRELESFSYSVSHDLRAPLRTIDGFSQAILEDYSDKLPEEGRAHLDRVRKATQNMANLIDDLLNLSRVTRAPLRSEPIDLSKFAAEIYDDLQRNHPERNVKFTIAENLKAKGDPHLIQDVLENFINNAWKFTSKRDQALIEFGSKRENDESIYFIRDNGAGFDMAYANKLFGAFQRLHSTSEFPGTGIGLATVQRIINRHGGRVWAESIIDQGTTFYFTLG
ncbi:MAG: PAS domain S-box protein [Anaerolineales bacterium]|nr:PAS domain S-box protein [Anaerolineales bacterium]